jgi:class 3 adenylate cyclase
VASQLSIGLENVRLYRQLDSLFRQYMSPEVATALIADPSQAALGGAMREVTVLFADLRGYSTFAERSSPPEIVAMLNRYFEVATAVILAQGGTIVQYIGDALMVMFNAPSRQSDHALRAARAALDMQRDVDAVAAATPGYPRFRIGVNSGVALIGNIGSEMLRNYNATGDAVNVAARLEATAEPGQVVIGAATYVELHGLAEVTPLGDLQVKGRRAPVTAYVLHRLRDEARQDGDR